jgi:hypothetical protein
VQAAALPALLVQSLAPGPEVRPARHVAGIVAAVLFLVIRSLILRSPHGYKRAFWVRRRLIAAAMFFTACIQRPTLAVVPEMCMPLDSLETCQSGHVPQFEMCHQLVTPAASQALPILIMGITWMIVAFIIQTGSKNKTWKEYDDSFAAWVGAVCGVGAGLFTLLLVMPLLKRRIDRAHERMDK